MMKLTNGEIFVVREPLLKLLGMQLPVKTSFQIAKLANKLNEQLKVIEDVRNGLVRKYGKENLEKRGQLSVNPEDEGYPKFVSDFNELMAQETELVFEKIKLPIEIDGKPLQIEPSILMALEKFVEIE
jgi:hypothetical protein